jgi:hypothetical protein
MLCGLFMFTDGSATFRVTLQSDALTAVAVADRGEAARGGEASGAGVDDSAVV